MSKVIIAKKPTMYVGRVCLNCGADLSNRRADAKFCCTSCYTAYFQKQKQKERRLEKFLSKI